MTKKKRFVQVGLGGRSPMYYESIVQQYADTCELVGLCDINKGRLEMRRKWCSEHGANVPAFAAEDFDRMVRETKCDTVVVTTRDSFHDEYICRAMELGCNVITEKPMTIDEKKCQRIIDTSARTGKTCVVTFNYRYSPPRTQVKDLLMSGAIGDVLSVDFHWLLNNIHGADYFRRWHRNKANSGGLMVHKATHHFDLVNWWLSSVPETVFAMGHRKFYTPQTADRMGLTPRGKRCMGCPASKKCRFHVDIAGNASLKELYLDNEKYDGYIRDNCVFGAEIDIEDNMNVTVAYASGAKMSYSLNAFLPWEGYMVSFNGTKGRLEHMCQESVYMNADGTVPGTLKKEGTWTKVFPLYGAPYQVELWSGEGGHGGGDPVMLDDIFSANPPKDKYLRAADQRSGAYSILTGIAANHSMATGKAIRVADLVRNIGLPDYAPMPTTGDPLVFG